MSENLFEKYLEKQHNSGTHIDKRSVESLISEIEYCIENRNSVYIFGNGGSASTANHFAADLSLLNFRTGKVCRAVSLNTDLALCTALSNDSSYERVIEEQLNVFSEPGDLAIGISASGNSMNLINALRCASELKLRIFAIVGFDGGKILREFAPNVIHIPTDRDFGLVENLQLSICHYVVDAITNKRLEK
jgi:D-sedoheptulose 7-phosphate isomerase